MTYVPDISKFFDLKLDYAHPKPAGYFVSGWRGLNISVFAYPHTINTNKVIIRGASFLTYISDFTDIKYMGYVLFSPFKLNPKKLFAFYRKQIPLQIRENIPKTVQGVIYDQKRLVRGLTEILNNRIHKKTIIGERREMLEKLVAELNI